MTINRIVEYVFFFVLIVSTGYLVFLVMSPFISALALSIVIVTICYPLFERVERLVYKNNRSLAAALTTLVVLVSIILPLVFVTSVFLRELADFYQTVGTEQDHSLERSLAGIERYVQMYVPEFKLDFSNQIKYGAEWLVVNLGTIFAGTLSTLLIIVISLIGSFYFFRDGKEFLRLLIKISPLPDKEDDLILTRLAKAVRGVATGVLLIALIQGFLATIGLTLAGINNPILWGTVAGIFSMIPGVGTSIVMVPATIYLFTLGSVSAGAVLLIWSFGVVGIVDNILGPKLMGRGNNLHPFIILLSVLGGISIFGPLGFVIGPVIMTLFVVLLEVYNQYLHPGNKSKVDR
jgi:predicted PurR-regulated permease PerM